MKYYKCKYDIVNSKSNDYIVENELLTENEFKRRELLPSDLIYFDEINISKFNTYKIFGIRFQILPKFKINRSIKNGSIR